MLFISSELLWAFCSLNKRRHTLGTPKDVFFMANSFYKLVQHICYCTKTHSSTDSFVLWLHDIGCTFVAHCYLHFSLLFFFGFFSLNNVMGLLCTLRHCFHSNKTMGEKARWELLKNAACCSEQILEAAPY